MEQVWERGERCVWRERWVACLRVLFLLWWEWLLFGWDLCEGERGENSGGEFVGLRLLLLVLVLGAVGVDGLFVLARSAN